MAKSQNEDAAADIGGSLTIALTVRIPEQLHADMKSLAAQERKTLTEYVIEAFARALKGRG